jgi:phytoene synthase
MVDLSAAYASCLRDCRSHYENFPVASLLVPRAQRRHVAAVYAFARAADDFADEGSRPIEQRLRLLDGWLERARLAASGAEQPARGAGEPVNTREIFTALGATIRTRHLPLHLFEDLLSAFRQDVTVTRYRTWPELLDYCRRSANPVGRLVLRISGQATAQFDEWSDAICTALQLTNFWQDLAIDFSRGRIYVPLETLDTHGAGEQSLAEPRLDPAWARALAAASHRTRVLFEAGRPLCDEVRGRLRYELRATWLGGIRILDRLEAGGFDVFRARPALGAADLAWLARALIGWTPRAVTRAVAS